MVKEGIISTGYKSPLYVQSLSEFGTPHELPKSGTWILKRKIKDSHYQDAMGCYPLFTCNDWSQLNSDLEELNGEIISFSAVTDPFGDYDVIYLRHCFKDLVIPFKEHYIIELGSPLKSFVSNHHQRNVKKGLKNVDVEMSENPAGFINEWVSLYENLIKKLNLKGINNFSRNSLKNLINRYDKCWNNWLWENGENKSSKCA